MCKSSVHNYLKKNLGLKAYKRKRQPLLTEKQCKNRLRFAKKYQRNSKLCSIEKLFADLGWESLQKRRNKHKLVIFYKILHGIAPTYLSDIVPPLIQDTTTYNLRNAGNIQNYRVHTNFFSNSFFPSTVRAWNDLPNDIKDAHL